MLAIVGVAIVNVRIRVALRVPALFIRERYFPAMMLVNYCRVICDKGGGVVFALIAVGTTSVPKMAPPDKSPTDINFLKYILEKFMNRRRRRRRREESFENIVRFDFRFSTLTAVVNFRFRFYYRW